MAPGDAAVRCLQGASPASLTDLGLAAEELAGPVVRSEAADTLAAGDAVEVRSLAVGMRGVWLPAQVLQVRLLSGLPRSPAPFRQHDASSAWCTWCGCRHVACVLSARD